MAARRLMLVGMMGSGKTTIGRLLSEQTGWRHVDNDDLVASATHETARELATAGEDAVRAAETDALIRGLATPEPCIVGTAAGTILDEGNRRRLREAGTVVWLRARPDTLARRALGGTHRPWLEADPLAWMTATALERDPLYQSVADAVVDVDDMSPAATADAILDHPAIRRVTET